MPTADAVLLKRIVFPPKRQQERKESRKDNESVKNCCPLFSSALSKKNISTKSLPLNLPFLYSPFSLFLSSFLSRTRKTKNKQKERKVVFISLQRYLGKKSRRRKYLQANVLHSRSAQKKLCPLKSEENVSFYFHLCFLRSYAMLDNISVCSSGEKMEKGDFFLPNWKSTAEAGNKSLITFRPRENLSGYFRSYCFFSTRQKNKIV